MEFSLDCYIKALEYTNRNRSLCEILIDFIKHAEVIEKVNGKTRIKTNIYECDKGKAYALANWDNYETCSALITHDLHSFECRDLGELVSKLRIG